MVLRVRTVWEGTTGSPYLSTMHFSGTDQAAADAAVAALDAFWSSVDDFVTTNLNWRTEPDVESIDANLNITGIFNTTPATGSGAVSGPELPWIAQGLIRWRTAQILAGRELRGRTFIPGATETHNDDGTPVASYVSGLQTAAATLIGTGIFGVLNRSAGVLHIAVSASAWTQWAALRSRRD